MKPLPTIQSTQGFSLIELMVGMAVGLLAVLAIMQSFAVFEGQKRTTTTGSEAQENGLLGMTMLEQDVRNAGAGFNNSAVFDCSTIYSYYDSGSGAQVPAPNMPTGAMAPITITDNTVNGTSSDTIKVLRSTDFLGAAPTTITSSMPQPSAELNVSRTTGFVQDQLILVVQGGSCQVMQVTQIQDAALKLQHNPGGGAPYNPSANCLNAGNPCAAFPAFSTGAEIVSLGSMIVRTWSITNNNLRMVDSSDPASTQTFDVAKDIVAMQAQYGVSTAAGVQAVSSWVDASAATGWNTLDATKVKRIKAVKVTLVARSAQKELTNVTASAPGGVDVSHLTDWQKYRYRVYTTIIPLRNVIWANV